MQRTIVYGRKKERRRILADRNSRNFTNFRSQCKISKANALANEFAVTPELLKKVERKKRAEEILEEKRRRDANEIQARNHKINLSKRPVQPIEASQNDVRELVAKVELSKKLIAEGKLDSPCPFQETIFMYKNSH